VMRRDIPGTPGLRTGGVFLCQLGGPALVLLLHSRIFGEVSTYGQWGLPAALGRRDAGRAGQATQPR